MSAQDYILLKENDDDKQMQVKGEENENHSFLYALIKLCKSSLPAIFGLLFVFLLETVNIMMIGKLNNPVLIASIGLGTLYVNTTGYIPGVSLLGGIETLCSQAFGQKNYKMVGNYTSIGRATVLLFFLLISVPMNFICFRILALLGIDPLICDYSSKFCHSMSISVFFALQFNTSLKYLQSMNNFNPGCIITLISAVLHPFWCYLFVFVFELDVIGAGLSMGVTQFTNFVFITIYIHYWNPCPESYVPYFFNSYTLSTKHILSYLRKAVPAAIMASADWIGFEILTFMASFFGSVSLAANVCLFNFISIIFMLQLGISIAATALVGNSVGSENLHNAKYYTYAALTVGLTVMITTSSLVLANRSSIPPLYTDQSDVKSLFYDLIGIYLLFSIPDSFQIIMNGVIKGLGKQKWASIICLIVLYPINITLAYYLGFIRGLGVIGLWYSQMVIVFILAVSLGILYLNVDMSKVVVQAKLSVNVIREDEIEENEEKETAKLLN